MLTLTGPVRAVTLYRHAAVVTRRAVTPLAAGSHEVEVVGLPLSLLDASVRVEAEADAGEIDVAQVRIGMYVAPREDLPEPPDEAELRRVERAIELAECRLRLVDAEAASLLALDAPDRPEPAEGQAPGPSPLAARLALDTFVTEQSEQRAKEREKTVVELDALERQRRDLEQRRQLASTAHRVEAQEITKSVVCRLRVEQEVEQARLTVRYQVPGVVWAPTYQVRVSNDGAEIALRALVAQRSGEDWSGVRLSVSTADPVSWTALPKMTALRIGRRQTYEEPAVERPPPAGSEGLFADYDAERRRLAPPSVPSFRSSRRAVSPPNLEFDALGNLPVAGSASFGGAGGLEPEGIPIASAVAEAPAAAMDFDQAVLADEMEEVAPKKERARRAKRKMAAMAPPPPAMRGGRSRDESTAVATSVFEAQLLDELELRGPDAPHRGHLARIDRSRYFREMATRTGRPLARSPSSLLGDAERAAIDVARRPLPADAALPGPASGHFDYTYDADAVVDVPSDGELHSVPLSVRRGACELTYIVVPRSDPAVYRLAQLENPEPSPLLPGPAEIYVDGQYVLTAALPVVPGQGRFELGLGVEQAVRCARNVRFREARSSDTVVATNDLHHELRYELANDLDRDVQCEVRERVPIPDEDAEVVIEERGVEPPWETYDQHERRARIRGGRRWRVVIPTRGSVELNATYVVRIYANHQIAGGNRRER